MRRIKEETIHTLARIGRKHRMLRYPILALLVVFVFIYNLFLYGFIHFKMRERLARGLAMAMTVILIFTSVNITAFAMSGDLGQGENYEESGDPVNESEAEENVAPEDQEESITPEAPENSEEGITPENPEQNITPEAPENTEESAVPGESETPEETTTPESTVSDGNAQVLSETVIALQQRIDALPSVEEFIALADGTYAEESLWNEAQMTIYYELQEIVDIYDGLSEEEQAQVDITKLLVLFEYINSAVMPLENAGVHYEPITISASSLNGNAIWGATESKSGVALDNYAHFYVKSRYDDGGLPVDGKITMPVSGVTYQLATGDDPGKAYDGNDCIRLTAGTTTKTMDLETIGVYQNIYVFATAGGPGGSNYAKFSVTLKYTDGTSDETTYKLYDWYGLNSVDNVEKYYDVKRINIGETSPSGSTGTTDGPVIHSAAIAVDKGKLLESITFTIKGINENADIPNNLYCCIFAVTGATPAGVPDKPVAIQATKLEGDTTGKFTANWNAVNEANGYCLDVSTDRQFKSFVGEYNNFNVGNVLNYSVSQNIDNNTVYYYRVRAVNSNGQSLSSNRIATDLPLWIRQALNDGDQSKVSYDAETNTITFSEDVTLKDTIILPTGDETIIDLNSNTVTAPTGKSAIAASGSDTKLEVRGSSEGNRQGTLIAGSSENGGNGSPAIDFGKADSNSTITVSGSYIKGGDGTTAEDGTAGVGGAGIAAGSGVNIEVGEKAEVIGGNGGNAQNGTGGTGGAGISGGNVSVAQNGTVTGGNGGNSASGTGGTGGNGVEDSANINTNGSVSGGNGGNSTNGNGGNGGTGVSGIDDDNVANNGNVTGGNGGNGTTGVGIGGEAGTSEGQTGSGNVGSLIHGHTWVYEADGAGTVIAYCTATEKAEECQYQGKKNALKFAITAENAIYDGKAHTARISENQITEVTGVKPGEITYYSDNGVETEPKNAGTYTAKVTLGGKTAQTTYQITKASQNVTVSMTDYTYGDTAAVPSITGALDNPKVTYYYNMTDSNSDGIEWKNITPTTLSAGEYYLYAVLSATDNCLETTTATVKFTVLRRTAEILWGDCNFSYNGKAQVPAATVKNLIGDDKCTVTVSGARKDTNKKTGEESYTATAIALSNPNYVLPTNGVVTQFTIAALELGNSGDLVDANLGADGEIHVSVRNPFGKNDEKLIQDTDYKITKEETESDYTITIEGTGNYVFKVIRKITKPQGKGNITTSVVTEPAVEKMNPVLNPVSESNAKKTLIDSIKDQSLKQRLENASTDLNYKALLYLEVKQVDSVLTTEEKKLITDSIAATKVLPAQAVVGKYIDLSLYLSYTISDNSSVLETGTEKITDTSDEKLGIGEGYKQVISLTIPEELLISDSSIVRTYYIIRAHEDGNGTVTVEVLNTVRDGDVLTFATDKFSTYAIAYADQKKQESKDNSEKKEESGNRQSDQNVKNDGANHSVQENTQNTQSVSAPKTGDDSHLMIWIVLLALSVIGMAGIVVTSCHRRKS